MTVAKVYYAPMRASVKRPSPAVGSSGVRETVDIGGPVHLERFGDRGRPMVLVHGLGSSHAYWLGVNEALARTHRVYVPDLPGFGRTPLAGRDAGLRANAAVLADLVHTLDEPAVLVGNSMGALLSMLVASGHPDEVAALVLVAPPAPGAWSAFLDPELAVLFTSYSLPVVGEITRWLWVRGRGPEGMVRSVLKTTLSPAAVVPDAVAQTALTVAYERAAHDDVHAFLRAYRSTTRFLLDGARYDALVRSIRAPAIVVHGTADRVIPPRIVRRLERLREDWTFVRLDGQGHMPHVEDPGVFVRIVAGWLSAQQPSSPAGAARRRRRVS